jgi:hypothetical protein
VRLDLAAMAAAFAAGTLVAEALGAANTGTAMAFGVFAFTLTLLWVLLKRP